MKAEIIPEGVRPILKFTPESYTEQYAIEKFLGECMTYVYQTKGNGHTPFNFYVVKDWKEHEV